LTDFTPFGISLAILGLFFLYRLNRTWFWSSLLGLIITGPLFLTYADYPTNSPFLLSAIEQFLLIPYFYFTIFLTFGLIFLAEFVSQKLSLFPGYFREKRELFGLGVKLSFVILPLFLVSENIIKVNLKETNLGDVLGYDVLSTTEPGAILLLRDDTVTFTTQYVYYGLNVRPDVVIIQPGQMRNKYYRDHLRSKYPNLLVPENVDKKDVDDIGYMNFVYTKALVEANLSRFPIYSYGGERFSSDWKWVPLGILAKLYPEDYKFSPEEYKVENDKIWQRYKFSNYNPKIRYKQLVIEHMIGVYYFGRLNSALFLKNTGDFKGALSEINKAIEIDSGNVEGWVEKAKISLLLNDCQLAKDSFSEAKKIDAKDMALLAGVVDYYKICQQDEVKAKEIEEIISKMRRPSELDIPLEKF
ncbi:MAG: hypothetical protein QXO27_04565, partial [Candidatus Aenigmatarchaeota archaeon]